MADDKKKKKPIINQAVEDRNKELDDIYAFQYGSMAKKKKK